MKTGFECYYRPNKADVDAILQTGIVFFDTNILLDIFRVEKKSAQTLLKVFEYLKSRVKLPYHVVEEYHDEYLSVLVKQKVLLRNAIESIKDKEKGMLSYVNKNHSGLSKYAKTIMRQALDKASKSVIASYNNTIKHLENEIQNDNLINRLSDIFSGSVLPALSKDELKAVFSEGVIRYQNQIPPGFKDADKDKKGILNSFKGGALSEDTQNIFGDLVIWKEIIKYTSSNHVDAVFVSNDAKDDWVCEICNEKHGPRVELLKEFYNKSGGHTILIYSFDQFVQKLNGLIGFIPDSDLKAAISSLDEPGRREERARLKSLAKDTSRDPKSTRGAHELKDPVTSVIS